jgi:hypothetical protein
MKRNSDLLVYIKRNSSKEVREISLSTIQCQRMAPTLSDNIFYSGKLEEEAKG